MLSLYDLLKNGSADGRYAISFLAAAGTKEDGADPRHEDSVERLADYSTVPAPEEEYDEEKHDFDQYFQSRIACHLSGLENCFRFIYSKLENLQTLIIEHANFGIHVLPRSGLVPPPSLFANLKKLYFNLGRDLRSTLNVQNAVWILVQCRQLEKAALGFDMFVQDNVKFLSEHCEAYSILWSFKRQGTRSHRQILF